MSISGNQIVAGMVLLAVGLIARAYSHGTLEYEITPKEGGETRSYSGKFLDILEKQVDGSWKIAIDCHNYNTPSE